MRRKPRMSRDAVTPGGEIVLYQSPDGTVQLEVRLERETVWLSQEHMAELFGRERSVITKHIRNVFAEGELDEKSNVQNLHITGSDKPVRFYNLDVIISIGYRVKSERGTQFRIWATRTLRDHLVRGYTLNERRLRERGLAEIEQTIGLMSRTLIAHALVTDDGQAVLEVVRQYTRAWRLLFEYDEDRLSATPARPITPTAALPVADARAAVARLREAITPRDEAGTLFGRERDDGLAGILGAIEQTFDGKALYSSVQVRAAHLLYFVIKDHPFGDGNKRIGTLLFLEYLRRNGLLTRADGRPRLADNAMVALALLIAESEPSQKDLIIRLVLNLLGDES
jgi:prophage maintenance system killer protein